MGVLISELNFSQGIKLLLHITELSSTSCYFKSKNLQKCHQATATNKSGYTENKVNYGYKWNEHSMMRIYYVGQDSKQICGIQCRKWMSRNKWNNDIQGLLEQQEISSSNENIKTLEKLVTNAQKNGQTSIEINGIIMLKSMNFHITKKLSWSFYSKFS